MDRPGTLVGVVGPSGAGKDSLIAHARQRFAGEPDIVFPRRLITRPADGGAEDHHAITPQAFAHMRLNGAFALDWHAHGLDYGIPAAIEDDLRAGSAVVVNLSRGILDTVRARYANRVVVAVSVDPQRLRQRLFARGRETAEDIERRLGRVDFAVPEGEDVVHIDNSAALDAAAAGFCAIVSQALQGRTDRRRLQNI